MARTGQWFLRSGIQEHSGGVARYYRTDLQRNHAVSTEITGYAVSTFAYLHELTGEERYLQRALDAARFLTREAWNGRTLPFELGSDGAFAYFFDCGIVVRGLLCAWRVTRESEFLDVAVALGKMMAADFASHNGDYHPILELPGNRPLERDPLRWSRSPGCYQLKSALAWWDLFQATGEPQFRQHYDHALESALCAYATFLPGHPDRLRVVDRLHAFLYFLEGLLPRAAERRCAAAICDGIRRVAGYLADTAPEFARSDVYAQLLRVRVYAAAYGIAALDVAAAEHEAAALTGYQAADADPRLDGGFYFGDRSGEFLPYVNPVSSAFALQALAMWQRHQGGHPPPEAHLLI